MDRGEIQNRQRAKQIINFKVLRYGNITPTDIDGFIDFGNRLFILIEIKYNGVDLPHGQRLAIERIVDNLVISGKKAIGIIATHEVENPEIDIDCAECIVKEIRLNSRWHTCLTKSSVKKVIDYYRNKYLI